MSEIEGVDYALDHNGHKLIVGDSAVGGRGITFTITKIIDPLHVLAIGDFKGHEGRVSAKHIYFLYHAGGYDTWLQKLRASMNIKSDKDTA